VRPIYKSYPICALGHKPVGYLNWLKQQDRVVVWDDAGHPPPLQTEVDWTKAGELVFDAPIRYAIFRVADTIPNCENVGIRLPRGA
jgi:hypothetical protein